jgi:hypothetical protein
MHFHTPFITSSFRVINGLILGMIGGIILLLVYDWFFLAKRMISKKDPPGGDS